MALELETLVARGIGEPDPFPRDQYPKLGTRGEREVDPSKVYGSSKKRGLRCMNGGTLTLSLRERWQL